MISNAGVTYSYDGDGKRVQKSSGTLYWYGTSSDPQLETNASGALVNEYIFFGGKRISRRDASSNIEYYFADEIGSSRVVTNASGTIVEDCDYFPYGGSNCAAFERQQLSIFRQRTRLRIRLGRLWRDGTTRRSTVGL